MHGYMIPVSNMNKITTFFSEISQQTLNIYFFKWPLLKVGTELNSSWHVSVAHGTQYEENPSSHHGGMRKIGYLCLFCHSLCILWYLTTWMLFIFGIVTIYLLMHVGSKFTPCQNRVNGAIFPVLFTFVSNPHWPQIMRGIFRSQSLFKIVIAKQSWLIKLYYLLQL